jgi:hypothetical protein
VTAPKKKKQKWKKEEEEEEKEEEKRDMPNKPGKFFKLGAIPL